MMVPPEHEGDLRMSRSIGRRIGSWAVIGVAAISAGIFAWLIFDTVFEKRSSPLAIPFLAVVAVGAVVATLITSRDTPVRGMPLSSWLEPKAIAAVFLAIVAGFSAVSLGLTVIEPRGAVESKPRAIETKVDRLLERTPEAPPPARIREKIVGVWGEPGCAVTYRFSLKDKALTIDGERRPAGAPPWRLVATETGSEGDVLHAVGEAPAEAKGDAVTFTYSVGGVERLTWDDQSGSVPLELDRC